LMSCLFLVATTKKHM